MTTETDVARHYATSGLLDRIVAGLGELGVEPDAAKPEDLRPIDEFHIGGFAATEALVGQLDLPKGARILDFGSGVGGPARHFAALTTGEVDGVDLTEEFVETAAALTAMTGVGRVRFHVGSALATPFDDASFDAAFLMHVGMNIADKPALMREAARVLKPGGVFAVYDVMRTGPGDLVHPLPWAKRPETSFVAPPADYRAAAEAAGFAVEAERARRDFALEFFAKQAAILRAKSGPPPLGLHLVMGPEAPQMIANMVASIEAGRIAPVELILRRAG